MKKIGRGHAGQNACKKSRPARRKQKSEPERSRAPWRDAKGTGDEIANPSLDAVAAWFLLHFAGAGAPDVTHERRAQNAGNSIFRHDPAQFVRSDSEQRQVEQADSARQPVLLNRDPGQCDDAGEIKREHARVLGQQLFLAPLLFRRFLAILLDREIVLLCARARYWFVHTIRSQISARPRVSDRSEERRVGKECRSRW